MSWYALQVASGREDTCRKALRSRGCKAFAPTQTFLRRVHGQDGRMVEVRRALMPGYLFFPANGDPRAALSKPGVYDVLRRSDGYPAPIPRDQIKRVAKAAPAEPQYRGIRKGSRVGVSVGMWRDNQFTVLSLTEKRAEVETQLMGKPVKMRLPLDMLDLCA